MVTIIIVITLQALAIAMLLSGIRRNEKSKGRQFFLVPGGRAILVAYGLFIIVFAIMTINLLLFVLQ